MEELINHLTLEHAQDAFNLRIGLTPMIDVEEGSPAAPWNGGDES
jgi:hypothetical protein